MDNLAGKQLVIIGLGAVGREIARKAKAFDMQVTGVSRTTEPHGERRTACCPEAN